MELAPIMLPLNGSSTVFLFPDLPERTFHRLPPMLADALPDDFGSVLIDAWMVSHGIPKAAVAGLDQLAYMGKRGMGALEFRPALGSHRASKAPLRINSLLEEVSKLIYGTIADERDALTALGNIVRVGTSAGGARPKAVVAWNQQTNEIRSGQFDVPEGFEHWLIKLDGVGRDSQPGTGQNYGNIEYAYYRMATDAGIIMTPCRLLHENGRSHFMTKRFDRDVVAGKTVKHHIQSLCAMGEFDFRMLNAHAYAQLFMIIADLGLGDGATEQAFLRMAFNVMAHNCDDHTKNFSFRLRKGYGWELAPAYDLTYPYNPSVRWPHRQLMSVNGKFEQITRQDLLLEADRFGVRRPLDLLANVRAVLDNWTQYAEEAAVPDEIATRIAADFYPL